MASWGSRKSAATNEEDYSFRETIKEQYQVSARNKSRFKWSVLCHIFLALVIVAKLIPAILDRLDIFVLEIEELFIPKPLLWEWLWLLSVPCTFLGLSACKKSNHSRMTKSFYGLIVFGLLPILFGLAYYGMGVLTYAKNKSTKGIETWKGYPVPLLWYAFFFLAIQAHLFELFVARKLIQAWQPRRKQH